MSVYLKHLKACYFRANRKGKSQILNEFCATSGQHRKLVIRLLTTPYWLEREACWTQETLPTRCTSYANADWLNQAEIAIGMYNRQCLGNTRIPNLETLAKKTKAWKK